MAQARMPTLYIPHGGGPCFFMDWNPPDFWEPTREYLENALSRLPRRPRALVVVSAHWVEPVFKVGTAPSPSLIYDYYGFPPHTYQLTYPAPGDPALAARVLSLLRAAGLPAAEDADRGYDHGVFVPLKVMAPEADIPIVTLSLQAGYDPAAHLAAGRALAALRDDDVLVLGSGMSFHNMRVMRGMSPEAPFQAITFDRWLGDAVEGDPGARLQALTHWDAAPHARFAHPPGGEEHLIPLMVVAGAAGDDPGRVVFRGHETTLPFAAFEFGAHQGLARAL